MGLVKGIVRRLEVPGEDGAHITVKMLSWLELDRSRRARLEALAGQLRLISGVQLPQTDAAVTEADPLTAYDRATLLACGVTEWTYGDPVDTTLLDERTAEWASRQILELSVPTEKAAKPPASPSTGT